MSKVRNRRVFPPNPFDPDQELRNPSEPEQELQREIASTLLLLDLFTLRALETDPKSSFYKDFPQRSKGNLDKINHGGSYDRNFLMMRIRLHVEGLPPAELDQITTEPIDGRFYQEMIRLLIENCQTAKEEKQRLVEADEPSWVPGEIAIQEELEDFLDILRILDTHVEHAAANNYLKRTVVVLDPTERNLGKHVKIALKYLNGLHQIPASLDDAERK